MRSLSKYYEKQHRKGVRYSATLHILFLLLAFFGLPSFLNHTPPPEPAAITVEVLPISAMSNVKPSQSAANKPEEKKSVQRKEAPPVQVTSNTPQSEKETKVTLPKPKEKIQEPKKEEPKKPEVKKANDSDLMAVLKAVRDTAKKDKQEDKKDTKDDSAAAKSISNHYDENLPMTISEKDAIMGQIAKCWNVPAGAKDAQNLVITIDAEYSQDGSYLKVSLASEDRSRYDSDSFFRAAADSAIRAVKQCSPLKNLPPEKYNTWRMMELRFDPKFMLN